MQTTPKTIRVIRNLSYAAICLALCIILPFLTGQIPQVGNMLSPMHIPVLLAGYLCGPWWAMAVGFIAPLLRFLLFGMPYILPTGLAMCFELLTYGLVSGLLYRALPKKVGYVYLSLVVSMLAGRIVWGIASLVIYGVMGNPFTWAIFFAGAFVNAVPGIIVHIVIIPILVLALRRARIITH